jgi:hypothetical protein
MGPVSPAELKKLAANGQLLPTDMVWKDGLSEWVAAKNLKGLFVTPTIATPPPPPPPSPASSSEFTLPPIAASPLPSQTPGADRNSSLNSMVAGLHKQRLAIAIAAGIGMLATFMPWAQMPIVGSVDGTAGDGWITLALFLPALILALRGDRMTPLIGSARLGAAIPAGIAALIGVWKIVEFQSKMAEMRADMPTNLRNSPFGQAMSTMSAGV